MAAKKTTAIVRAELVNVRPAADADDEPPRSASVVDGAVDRVADRVKRAGRKGETAVRALADFARDVGELFDELDDDGRGPPPHVTMKR